MTRLHRINHLSLSIRGERRFRRKIGERCDAEGGRIGGCARWRKPPTPQGARPPRCAESGWARPGPGAVKRMCVARKAQAAQFAANVLPIIRDIQAAGHTSLNLYGAPRSAAQQLRGVDREPGALRQAQLPPCKASCSVAALEFSLRDRLHRTLTRRIPERSKPLKSFLRPCSERCTQRRPCKVLRITKSVGECGSHPNTGYAQKVPQRRD